MLDWFQRSHSHLSAAKATDLELYEATYDPEQPPPRAQRAPEMAETDMVVQLLMGIHELLQGNVGWTAANAPKGAKKPKIKKFPRPKTAAQLFAAQEAREAHEFIESHLTYVDTATFNRALVDPQFAAEVADQARDGGGE